MTDVVMHNLQNDNDSMNEMLYKSDIINNLVALINLESKEFKNIILFNRYFRNYWQAISKNT